MPCLAIINSVDSALSACIYSGFLVPSGLLVDSIWNLHAVIVKLVIPTGSKEEFHASPAFGPTAGVRRNQYFICISLMNN